MKSNLKNDTISFLLFFMAIFYQATLFGQVNYTTGPNNSQINNTLQGTGLTISGGTLLNGNRNLQIATYSNGIGAGLDAANGVYFSTGNAAIDLNQKNQWPYTSNAPAGGTTYSDPDLTAINPDARFDALVYSFSVTLHPSTTALRIRYQFGSEEYPDWVGTPYDDTFGFFVSGPGIVGKFNMARLPNGNPTRINTVNSGTRGYQVTYNNNYYVNNPPSPLDFSQGAMYINNGHTTALDGQGFYLENTNPQPGPFPVFVEFNAITKLITYDLKNLTPGATYTFKIAIADASDEQRDCGVFIDEIKGVNGADVFITKTMNNMTPPIGSTVQFTLTAGNFGPYDATNTNVNDLLPSGYTYVSHVTTQGTTYNAVSGVWSLGTLIKNTNPTLVINATVNPSGSYTNTATISAVDPDPDLSNNTSWVAPLCPNPPQVPNYSVKQPTCSATYGTISVSNPPNGMEYSLNNGVYQQNASFTNLTPGSYVLCARSQGNPSCPIACTGTITINAIPSTPVTPQYTVTQPTCAVNSGSVAITSTTTGLEISLDGGVYGSATTFNGLSSGSHTICVRNTSDSSCFTCESFTINPVATAPNIPTLSITQPTCAVNSGSVAITSSTTGLEISLDGGVYGSTTTFNGLSSGSHTICVRNTSDPSCFTCESFTINPVATAPNTPTLNITQPTCAVNSGSVAITSSTTGLEISLDGGAYESTTTFNGLSSGSHTICVRYTSDSSCFTCESFTINPVATAPNTPTLNVIQPTCAVNSGSVSITSSTTGLEISLDGGAYGNVTTFNGLSSGSHTICVRNTSDPTCTNCSAVFTINPVATAPSVPTLSITQPTCAVNSGSVAITSTTTGLEISLDGGAYGSATTFNGLSSGQHTICVRNTSDSSCFTCETFTLNPVAIAPSAPILSITQPTCAVNSGNVAITSSTTGLQIRLDGGAYGSTTTFNGLSSGSHTICVRNTSDPTCFTCESFTINPVAIAPSAPTLSITQPTCAVNSGSVAITSTTTGLEISLDGGVYGSATTFNGLSSGLHTICVRNTSDPTCTNCSVVFTINPVATAPNTPTLSITQPTCAVNSGSVSITSSTTGLQISLDGGVFGTATTFNGLSSGSHTICVRNTSDPTCTNCSAVFTIDPVATAPNIPTLSITQPTCAVNSGSVSITSSTTGLEISLDGGAYGSATTFNGLSSGQHTICVRNTSDSSCFTCESFTINPVATAPSAPTLNITQPTCAVNSGSVAITSTTTGLEISLDGGVYGSAITFNGLSSGQHTICVRNTSDPTCFTCETFTVNPVATAPNAPTLNVIQPTCAVNSGSVSITSSVAGLEISLDNGTYGTAISFSSLSSGSHTICVRNTSDPTCFTCESFTINPVATAPNTPTLSITQPTCAVNSGSVAITSSTTGLEISLDGGAFGSATTFNGLSSGSHTICVRNTSDASCFTCETFTVNPVATAPNAPTLNVIQPTCAVNSGSVSITSSVAGLEISLDNGTYGTAISFSSLSSGSHTICVRNTSDPSCMSCSMFSINASICAEDDIFLLQACTPFIATVLDNDTLDGNYITDISLVLLNAVTQNGITIQTDGSITLDSTVVPGTYTLQYNLCEAQNPSNCDTATLTIEITPSEIKIFNNVTANNDNINDYLMVEGVTFYPDNTMQIFNRWGTLVYEENGYNNLDKRFEGRSTAHLTINASEGLPVGTYYYIFKYVDCHNQPVVKNGYLYINR